MGTRLSSLIPLAGAFVMAACGGRPDSRTAAKPAAPTLFTAEYATVNLPLTVPSQVYVEQDTWLYARATGVLESLLVDIGSVVHAGDVVATLERTDQALALQRAEASWDSANRAVTRVHGSAATESFSAAEIDQAEINLRQADLARAQAHRAMDLTRVTAPFAGVVAARSGVRAGHLVVPGDSIVRITALAPLRAAIHIPEMQAVELAVGAVASVSGPGGSARATVIRAAPSVDAASGTRELVLELAGNPPIRPGASVTVRLGGERRRIVVIPAAAVGDSGYVVVWQDGRTSLRAVTLGQRLPDGRVEVVSGLAAGERVLPWAPVNEYKLRSDLTIVEQTYRDEQSYIVKEHVEHRYYAFSFIEVLVMQQFDGEMTCGAIAAGLAEQGLAINEAAVESFARKLTGMGLLEQSIAQRSILLMERMRAQRNRRVKKERYRGTFLRMRWSIGDPNEFFNKWTPRLGFFFSAPFIAVSIALFVAYFGIVFARHDVFLSALRAMYHPASWSLGFFLTFWVTGITVIAIHEFGHGFACKYFGGDVHEMGAMLIYLQPAFYCNVNDAWTFPELKARLWVTAAGSWIQMVVAGLAAIVWWAVEPDTLVSQVALIAVLIGGAMTLLANANPLIPLDGYYALSDYLGVPNLRKRAFEYVGYSFKHHILRLGTQGPPASAREKRIFLVYGLLAVAYSGAILTLLLSRFIGWVAGTLGALATIVLAVMIWVRVRDRIRLMWRGIVRGIREHPAAWRVVLRPRIIGCAVVVMAIGLLVPWTVHVGGSFVAVTPVYVVLTATGQGIVARVVALEGSVVPAGAPIVTVRDIDADRQQIVLARQVDSLAAREAHARAGGSEADAQRLAAQQAELFAALTVLRERSGSLDLRAPVAGVIVTRRLEEMTGRHVARGDTLVQLVGTGDSLELRVTLEGAGATRVHAGQPASVISLSDLASPLRAQVTSVAAASAPVAAGAPPELEARIRVPATGAWRAGVTGRVSIAIWRTNLFGALWWNVRKRVRSDFLM